MTKMQKNPALYEAAEHYRSFAEQRAMLAAWPS